VTLNHDCVRAVLLYIEKNQVYQPVEVEGFEDLCHLQPISSIKICRDLSKQFKEDDIRYACVQACDGGYLDGSPLDSCTILINDITFKGHEFIRVMKNDNVWSKVKDRAAKFGGLTLDALFTVASSVLSDMLAKGI